MPRMGVCWRLGMRVRSEPMSSSSSFPAVVVDLEVRAVVVVCTP